MVVKYHLDHTTQEQPLRLHDLLSAESYADVTRSMTSSWVTNIISEALRADRDYAQWDAWGQELEVRYPIQPLTWSNWSTEHIGV